jgi:16S rRNA processing protein RimM
MPDATGPPAQERMVILGRFGGPWGVKGWIKVESYTAPPAGILGFPTWHVAAAGGRWETVRIVAGRPQGTGRALVVELEGVSSPEAARRWVQREVAQPRSALPATRPGEYYWDDLPGCRVATLDGVELGVISHFHEFPGNPVMVVQGGAREHWVPLVPRHLKQVDLGARRVVVDWDPEF